MIRYFDIFFAILGIFILTPLFLVVIIIGIFDTGSPIFFQKRVGRGKKSFKLIKFRSMHINTISVATHLVGDNSITVFGKFLRKTKIDELPQLWNVLVGDMSLVGPRPSLFNQEELINERDILGVYSVRPGITGLAQINMINMSSPKLLAETDAKMIRMLNTSWYFNCIIVTILGKKFSSRLKISL
jgi:lipopolysaccharide/colanic/teichoic acid biosynthesis glycosyltransferase